MGKIKKIKPGLYEYKDHTITKKEYTAKPCHFKDQSKQKKLLNGQ
jgi:hypothetical protein